MTTRYMLTCPILLAPNGRDNTLEQYDEQIDEEGEE